MSAFMQQRTVNCPQCGKEVIWEPASRFRPFCSERCKTNDLSQWAQESYRISEAEKDPENTITTEPI
ncbi:MAG: DNA gyrase inhibitor YacG [Nitrosomonas sp.]